MQYWDIRILKYLNIGNKKDIEILALGYTGILKYLNITGMLKYWNIENLVYWDIEISEIWYMINAYYDIAQHM